MERTSVEEIMEKDFLSIDLEERVSKLLGLFGSRKKSYAVVFDSSHNFLGLTSLRELLYKRTDFSKMKVKNVTNSNVPLLSRDTSLMKAAELMYVSDSRVLPVVEGSMVYGVVSADAIIREAAERSPIASMKAREIASLEPVTLNQNESIDKAVSEMKKHNVKRLLGVDSSGHVSGILSLQAVLEKYLVHSTGQSPGLISAVQSKEKVSGLNMPITSELLPVTKSIGLDDRIGPVISDIESGYAIVVVEKGKPAGIITRRDLLEEIVKSGAVERNIQIVNAPELDEIDLAKVNDTINASYDRVKKSLGSPYALLVHFKQYKKSGARVKHSVHIRASSPDLNLKAEAVSWNVITSLQSALKQLEREIRKSTAKKRKAKKQ